MQTSGKGKVVELMSEKKKKDPLHPETFFLPPLKMILTFFDKESRQEEREEGRER